MAFTASVPLCTKGLGVLCGPSLLGRNSRGPGVRKAASAAWFGGFHRPARCVPGRELLPPLSTGVMSSQYRSTLLNNPFKIQFHLFPSCAYCVPGTEGKLKTRHQLHPEGVARAVGTNVLFTRDTKTAWNSNTKFFLHTTRKEIIYADWLH